jgi:hypothetical protein
MAIPDTVATVRPCDFRPFNYEPFERGTPISHAVICSACYLDCESSLVDLQV